MKVKNIMFSGFAAAILAGMCGSADAATVLASKTYVDNQVKTRQAPLSAENDSITIENVTDDAGNVTGAKIRANLPSLSGLATESYVQERIAEIDIPTTEGLATTEEVNQGLAKKQNVLTAGDGINITETTDEATGAVTTTIKTNIDLSGLATKTDIENMVEESDIADVVRTDDIANMVEDSDIANMVTTDVLATDLAKKQNVLTAGDGINITTAEDGTTTIDTAVDFSTLATKDEIVNMATTGYVDTKTADIATLNTDVAQLKTDVAGKQNELTSTNLIGGDNVDVDINAETGVITLSATDTNTTYETATATESGLTKLYDATGENTDGTMTQAAITSALGNKVDLSTYNQHITDQAAKDLAQDNAIDALVGSDGQSGSFTELQTAVTRLDGDADVTGSVKQQVAAALEEAKTYADDNDADTIYDDTELAGRVTALEDAGYQTAGQVEDAIKAGNFLSDTMTENGTYLVQQTADGVAYYAISIVDGEGKDVITGQPVVE